MDMSSNPIHRKLPSQFSTRVLFWGHMNLNNIFGGRDSDSGLFHWTCMSVMDRSNDWET
jgi:hypothetical protein